LGNTLGNVFHKRIWPPCSEHMDSESITFLANEALYYYLGRTRAGICSAVEWTFKIFNCNLIWLHSCYVTQHRERDGRYFIFCFACGYACD
jgi:hypothetical protein